MTNGPKPGDRAPSFTMPIAGGGDVRLEALKGKTVVLFFYPKDDTSGCTQEALNFTEKAAAFSAKGAVVIGVSRDSVASHEKFRDKHALNVVLASDSDGKVTEAYGVWVEKSMYGKKYMGIERSTFLIGPDGAVVESWRKVKVPGHADAILAAIPPK